MTFLKMKKGPLSTITALIYVYILRDLISFKLVKSLHQTSLLLMKYLLILVTRCTCIRLYNLISHFLFFFILIFFRLVSLKLKKIFVLLFHKLLVVIQIIQEFILFNGFYLQYIKGILIYKESIIFCRKFCSLIEQKSRYTF